MRSFFARAARHSLGRVSFLAVGVLLAGPTVVGQTAPKAAAKPVAKNAPAPACTVQATNYQGWKATQMANRWVKLEIVPQLGGRLMQVTFGGHDFLLVNPALQGQVIPFDTAHPHWNNYGGDKIWPMPEGNQDEQHWAGEDVDPTDGSAFALQVISRGKQCSVRMTGPVDAAVGQQYIRDISIGGDSPVISFHAVMKNVSGYPQTWSEQSVSQYNAADPADPSKFNPKFWGLTPANPATVFPGGFHVRSGSQTNPAYSVSDGMFRLHWGSVGGEVWVDSPGGWLAVVDGSTGYTMVERNHFDPAAEYPGKATMLFYTTGQRAPRPAGAGGQNRAGGGQGAPAAGASAAAAPNMAPRAPVLYMEAEVNSPMIELKPGETYAMDTQWYPTRMGEDFKTATWAGVVGTPLTASRTAAGLVLAGGFGVFYAGDVVAHYYNRGGAPVGTVEKVAVANPTEALQLQATVQAPPETARVSLHLVDAKGADRGPLGEVMVNPPPAGGRRGGGF